jgi:DNA-binding CsgD family transcriptional regulator
MSRDTGVAIQADNSAFEFSSDSDPEKDNHAEELKFLHNKIAELNTTIDVLSNRIGKDLVAAQNDFFSRIQKFILPDICLLQSTNLDQHQTKLLDRIKFRLDNIINNDRLNEPDLPILYIQNKNKLTQKEMLIFNLLRDGKSSKEIAKLMGLNKSTILTHRHHIRKKFGLINSKVNIKSYAAYDCA